MELRHFHSFIAVAEELNFTKAARRLQIAQPPVSRHIRDLETELGVKLFERNSSRVFLTDAGRGFLNEVRVALQHVSQAVEAARQAGSGGTGTVRLGIGKGLGDVVSRIVNEYLRLFPRVEIDVRDIASGFQAEAFFERKIDVGFMRSPIDAPQLASAPLFQEQFSVVLRKSSPLAKHKVLHLPDLAGETLLLIDRRISPGAYDQTLALFREHGVEPKVVSTATMPYEEAGSILVDSGKGIYFALGKNPIHPSFIDRLIALPLKEPSALIEVRVVWRKDEQAKPTLEFVHFTRSKFENKEGFKQDQNIASGGRKDKRRKRSHLSAPARRKGLRRVQKKR
jgi:DNA-binding transcriptional LysR family regulator